MVVVDVERGTELARAAVPPGFGETTLRFRDANEVTVTRRLVTFDVSGNPSVERTVSGVLDVGHATFTPLTIEGDAVPDTIS